MQFVHRVAHRVVQGAPTLLSFQPINVPDLRQQFLDYHEHVLKSSVGTLRRYRAATQHLEDFVCQQPRSQRAVARDAVVLLVLGRPDRRQEGLEIKSLFHLLTRVLSHPPA